MLKTSMILFLIFHSFVVYSTEQGTCPYILSQELQCSLHPELTDDSGMNKEEYNKYSADQKSQYLWDRISKSLLWNETEGELYSMRNRPFKALQANFLPGAILSYERFHDETSDFFESERIRLVHEFGSVAKGRLVITNPYYTSGLLQTGANLIIRASSATPPVGIQRNNFAPGIAIKFLIDGQRSRDLVLGNGGDGQGSDMNFFKYGMSNQNKDPKKTFIKFFTQLLKLTTKRMVKILKGRKIFSTNCEGFIVDEEKKYWEPRKADRFISVDQLYKIDRFGNDVPPEQQKIVSHFEIEPPEHLQNKLDASYDRRDYRVKLWEVSSDKMLLYNVFVWKDREEQKTGHQKNDFSNRIHIGHIELDSKFSPSRFGDYTLRFYHRL